MGFGRTIADAKTVVKYICALDTAIKLPPEPDLRTILTEFNHAESHVTKAALLEAVVNRYGKEDTALTAQIAGKFINESSVSPLDLTVELEKACRMLAHSEYRESGNELVLGDLDSSVMRWHLCTLRGPEVAQVKGMLEDSSVPPYTATYKAYRYALSRVLVGCEGWDNYANDKKGRVSEETLDSIPDDWVIDIGAFVLKYPELKQSEKKA